MPIYVEPKGLREVDRSMASTIRGIDLSGRLRVSLKRVLAQLHLDFIVKGGVLFISSADGIARENKATTRSSSVTIRRRQSICSGRSTSPFRCHSSRRRLSKMS